MRILLVSLILLLVNLAIFFAFDAWANVGWGFAEAVADTNSWTRNCVATGAVFFGILAQVLTTRLQDEKGDQIEIGAQLKLAFNSRDFVLAALISPIVVAVALQAASQQSSVFLVALIAFQNGFFFRSIMNSKKPKR